ncbi:hypothetical protein BUALT_Bualt18G0101600 [Buddleja alternifolia]|uniref:THH1/TOM1/TOM3 domain-containing protein n=2 Tax=Magnoliopsida TaxID=3398 RepID=A0AAV6WAC5_9LAMI|nr:hypothetical protein BUALT_Bualt18G0101600 [Buddleja alternifolia]
MTIMPLSFPVIDSGVAVGGPPSSWWYVINESVKWQDGIFFTLCAVYAVVSAVALIQFVRIELRVPEYGWTTQKVFHLMNFIVNGGPAFGSLGSSCAAVLFNLYNSCSVLGRDISSAVSFTAALGFLLSGGSLYLMLKRFPVESKGRTKKLHEVVLSVFDRDASLYVLDHPVLNLIYYVLITVERETCGEMTRMPLSFPATGAAVGVGGTPSSWWYEINESVQWQDGIFFALCAVYAVVSAVALIQLIKIELRVPEYGWTIQKVFHLMNFIVNGVRAFVFGFHKQVFLLQPKAKNLPTDKLRIFYISINGAVYFIQVCIWVYLWIDDSSFAQFIGKIFIAVVSCIAALGFLLYGGGLFFMLRRFPIESKGRRKKLHEVGSVTAICFTCFLIRCFVVVLSAFDSDASLYVLDHPVLNFIYYVGLSPASEVSGFEDKIKALERNPDFIMILGYLMSSEILFLLERETYCGMSRMPLSFPAVDGGPPPSSWWYEINESVIWQDGIFFTLCAVYAVLSAVALIQLIRIELRVPEYGWTTQKVFDLMNFIVNGVRAFVFGFHKQVFLLRPKVLSLVLLDLPGLLFFSTYTLLVLFWAEIYHQAKNLPTDKLRIFYISINGAVYFIQVCIWVYLWIDDSSFVQFIGKIFIAVVSCIAASAFLLYGGRLFLMLNNFPIESEGRRKKLRELCTCRMGHSYMLHLFSDKVLLSAFDPVASLYVLDHPVLNLIYYVHVEILPSALVLYILRKLPPRRISAQYHPIR